MIADEMRIAIQILFYMIHFFALDGMSYLRFYHIKTTGFRNTFTIVICLFSIYFRLLLRTNWI